LVALTLVFAVTLALIALISTIWLAFIAFVLRSLPCHFKLLFLGVINVGLFQRGLEYQRQAITVPKEDYQLPKIFG
jgi:hypothetical protein